MIMKIEKNKTFPIQNCKQLPCHLLAVLDIFQKPGNSIVFGQYFSPLTVTHLCFALNRGPCFSKEI